MGRNCIEKGWIVHHHRILMRIGEFGDKIGVIIISKDPPMSLHDVEEKEDNVNAVAKLFLLEIAATGSNPVQNVKHGSEIKSEIKAEGYTSSSDLESDGDDTMQKKGDEKKKNKRNRNQISDLRFEKELAELDGRSKRNERKKK